MRQRSNRFQAGLLAAILAVTLQFVLWAGVLSGAVGQPATPQLTALSATQSHCITDQAPGHHHLPGTSCLLCPVCLALSLPGTLPGPQPTILPPTLAGRAPDQAVRNHQAAPAPLLAAAYPRGPPLT
jgi:hypothetical protein